MCKLVVATVSGMRSTRWTPAPPIAIEEERSALPAVSPVVLSGQREDGTGDEDSPGTRQGEFREPLEETAPADPVTTTVDEVIVKSRHVPLLDPAFLLQPVPDGRFKQSRCRCDEDADGGALIAKHRPSSEYEQQATFEFVAVAGSELSKRIVRPS